MHIQDTFADVKMTFFVGNVIVVCNEWWVIWIFSGVKLIFLDFVPWILVTLLLICTKFLRYYCFYPFGIISSQIYLIYLRMWMKLYNDWRSTKICHSPHRFCCISSLWMKKNKRNLKDCISSNGIVYKNTSSLVLSNSIRFY